MKVRDPHELISKVNIEHFNSLKGMKAAPTPDYPERSTLPLNYVEPNGSSNPTSKDSSQSKAPDATDSPGISINKAKEPVNSVMEDNVLKGKIQRLGDYIDTDAVCTILPRYRFNSHC